MKFIAPNLRLLEGQLISVCTCAIDDQWRPRYTNADEAYENLDLSLRHLRKQLGEAKYLKLLDMMETARKHFEMGDMKRGARLMQDMGQVIRNKPPFAYPHDEWRWGEPLPIDMDDLTESDI